MPIPPSIQSEIDELLPEARLARRQHSVFDVKAVASARLNDIFAYLVRSKTASTIEISEATGLTYQSVRARVMKGYEV